MDYNIIYFYLFGLNFENFCSVACGLGLSLIVVDRANVGDRLDQVTILNIIRFFCLLYTSGWSLFFIFNLECSCIGTSQEKSDAPHPVKLDLLFCPLHFFMCDTNILRKRTKCIT